VGGREGLQAGSTSAAARRLKARCRAPRAAAAPHLLADQPPRRVLKRDARQRQLLLQHQRLAAVGGHDDLLVLRDGAQQRHAQHLLRGRGAVGG
jgi:hypothetical protein